jgi:hypothetical protein
VGSDLEARPTRLATTRLATTRLATTWAVGLLAIQFGLLVYRAGLEGYTRNEHAHLAAGVSHWEFGNYDSFRVNPPLIRSLAATGVYFHGYRADWSGLSPRPEIRSEFPLGSMFVYANRDRCYDFLWWARLSTLWLVPVGGYFLWRWSRQLWGATGSWISLILWVFSPNLLAHGSLIAPDAGSAALGLISLYAIWHWFRTPNFATAYGTGLMLGLALLSKFTVLLWLPILALMVGLRCVMRSMEPQVSVRSLLGQWSLMLFFALVVINLGYTFRDVGWQLGKFEFISRAMTDGPDPAETGVRQVGNRFQDSWWGLIPVPVPKDYLMGMDIQKWDFESQMDSYLCGEWKKGGWWHYYLVALGIKEPLGGWLLLSLAVATAMQGCWFVARGKMPTSDWLIRWLVPGLGLLSVVVFVSLQTGINHHLRYVLGGLPFVYLLCGAVGPWSERTGIWQKVLIGSLVGWSVISSLSVYPHSLAYFNEVVGGPSRGRFYLNNSNIDWGQDFLHLQHWVERHPELRPLSISFASQAANPPPRDWVFPEVPTRAELQQRLNQVDAGKVFLEPGWYALCVTNAVSQSGHYDWLATREPKEQIGWSILVFDLKAEDIQQIMNDLLEQKN